MKKIATIVFSLALILGIGFATHASAQVAPECTGTNGYSPVTAMSCNGATVIPNGCSSTAGFSASTGTPCNGATAAANGYDGTMVDPNGFLSGCSSTGGFSPTTGLACNLSINGVVYTGGGTTVNTGLPTTTTVSNPGLPTTGAGQHVAANVAILLGAVLAAGFAARYAFRSNHSVAN